MKEILCKLGIHNWRIEDWNDTLITGRILPYKCLICGKTKWVADNNGRTKLGSEAVREVDIRIQEFVSKLKE